MATEKVSLTLDVDVLREAREQAGPRGLSAFVNEMLRLNMQHERIKAFLAEAEAEHGPIPDHIMEEVRRRWPIPGESAKPRKRRSA